MHAKKKIEKIYINKINELIKHDKAYFKDDNPLISDKDYDKIKEEILLKNQLSFIKPFYIKSLNYKHPFI